VSNCAEQFYGFVTIFLGLLTAAGLPYLILEHRWRWRWREVPAGLAPAHEASGAVYRQEGTVSTYLREAPPLIRMAAFSCLLFGQMFVPGLLVGAFGLIVGGIGMVSIPGLITAAKLYCAGLALLRREPRAAYFGARNAAAWALWLNGTIFAVTTSIALVARISSVDFWAFYATLNGYGLLSVLQALLLIYATRKHEDALFAPSQLVRIAAKMYAL
jgi:hypothetical protein